MRREVQQCFEAAGIGGVTMIELDDTDRSIINNLQGGFPLSEDPFTEVGAMLGFSGEELRGRISRLLEAGALSRFGPMYNAELMGGGLTLAALKAPEDRFDQVAEQVNTFPEVAHNYARDHALNMWFVIATETPERVVQVIDEIETVTGLHVYNMPKTEEFFIGLRLEV